MSTPSIRQRQSQSQTPGPRGSDGRPLRLSDARAQRQATPLRNQNATFIPRVPGDQPKPLCRNNECPQSKVEDMDGRLICTNCGFVLEESQITEELTFGEASNGAAIVQGAFVGEGDTAARNPAMAGNRMGIGMTSREQTERNGLYFMNEFLGSLRLQPIDRERGMKYFKLAANQNLIQGRITKHVAAVCLYLGCRNDSSCKVMLIDFADVLQVNVFKLGHIYQSLVAALHIAGDGRRGNLYECNPENLIQRFAQDMEFGENEHRIANEAVNILKRMKRDWIYTGRRPAGVCGAALILAARMNNYRRTVREMVYTAKVADVTIHKRLDEFKFTDSSKLTVSEFRDFAQGISKEADPPSFYQQFEPKKKKRKNAKRTHEEIEISENEDEDAALPNRASEEPSPHRTSPQRVLTREEEATQAMPPPLVPIDPRLQPTIRNAAKRVKMSHTPADGDMAMSDSSHNNDDDDTRSVTSLVRKRRAGRPKGAKNRPLPVKTADAEADEQQIEKDMLEALEDPEIQAVAEQYHQSILPTPPATQQPIADTQIRAQVSEVAAAVHHGMEEQTQPVFIRQTVQPTATEEHGQSASSSHSNLDSVTLYDYEFEDDPEVRDCLLTPAEVQMKEAVWVTHNGKWLLDQQARKIKRELQEINHTLPQKRRRHRKRLGDLSAYETVNEDGTISRPTTASEAVKAMLENRGYSKNLNYDFIKRVYNRTPSEASGSPSTEQPFSLIETQPPRRKSTASKAGSRNEQNTRSPKQTRKQIPAPPLSKARNAVASSSKASLPVPQPEDEYAEDRDDLLRIANEGAPSPNGNEQDTGEEGDPDYYVDDQEEVEDYEENEGNEDEDNYSGSGEEFE